MKKVLVVSLGAVVASLSLFSCGPSTSSSEISSSISLASKRVVLSLSRTSFYEGQSLLDGMIPTVTYVNNGRNTDISSRDDLYSLSLWNSEGVEVSIKDTLKEGRYGVKVKYDALGLTSEKVDIEVVKSTPSVASVGSGVQKVSNEHLLSTLDGVGSLGKGKLPSIGNRKILVVPVTFTDAPSWSEADIEALNKAYFGEASDTSYESLKSFYEKSSYGKLHLSGEVAPTYVYPGTCDDFEANDEIHELVLKAVASLKANGFDVSNYDTDNDGYIDGVELLYKTSKPIGAKGDDYRWWNVTNITYADPNVESPNAYRYFWSSFSSLGDDIDTRTIIHETGHMLGLNDYYSYDGGQSPMGMVDMMDYNVGDHNAYSKFLMGHVSPMYVDGTLDDFEITLNDFESSGDCLLFRNYQDDPYNESPYDEYIMLQFYSPTLLNEKDSHGYKEWSSYGRGGTYDKVGLQMYHVDNRLVAQTGKYDLDTHEFKNISFDYVDEFSNETVYHEDGTYLTNLKQYTSNTTSRSYYLEGHTTRNFKTNQVDAFREIMMLPGDASSVFLDGEWPSRMGESVNLLGLGDSYGGDCYTNAKYASIMPKGDSFNDGSKNPWSFTVSSQSDSSITLHFISNNK